MQLGGVISQISENPSNYGLFLIIIFVVAALVFGIPAVLSRNINRVILVVFCTLIATLGTYFILF